MTLETDPNTTTRLKSMAKGEKERQPRQVKMSGLREEEVEESRQKREGEFKESGISLGHPMGQSVQGNEGATHRDNASFNARK